jgi:uncharacterized membrane protein
MRRNDLPPDERFRVSIDLRETIRFKAESGWDRVLTILLVLSILAALFALIYVIVSPKQGERFTEFYILGEGGKAAEYPTGLMVGKATDITVGVVNNEYEKVDYTLSVVLENRTLHREALTLLHNRSWEESVFFTPMEVGSDLKLEFLLYRNDSPVPYRSLHLWVDVK